MDPENDGWRDVVVTTNGGAPVMRHNRGGRNHWIGLRNVAPASIVRWPRGVPFVTAGRSYLSPSDPRVLIGLGNATEVASLIEVDSPGKGGHKRWLERPGIDRYIGEVSGAGVPRRDYGMSQRYSGQSRRAGRVR